VRSSRDSTSADGPFPSGRGSLAPCIRTGAPAARSESDPGLDRLSNTSIDALDRVRIEYESSQSLPLIPAAGRPPYAGVRLGMYGATIRDKSVRGECRPGRHGHQQGDDQVVDRFNSNVVLDGSLFFVSTLLSTPSPRCVLCVKGISFVCER
jgi:hypothetical protein